jgi:hypothetical protein
MDIITDFGSVVPGSSPGGCTKANRKHTFIECVFSVQRAKGFARGFGARRSHVFAIHYAKTASPGRKFLANVMSLET